MASILKGAPVVAQMNEALMKEVAALKEQGIVPTLAILRVGERPDDVSYERGAMKRCDTIGVAVKNCILPESVTQREIMAEIEKLNGDAGVHGVLLLRPLPRHVDEEAVRNALSPEKDVDGVTDASLSSVFTGTGHGFPPCTAQACVEILGYYGYDVKGKRATVVGRSLVVGKPVAMLLMEKHATVTVCHTRTVDLPAVCRQAEILVVAAGKPHAVGKECLSEGQIVIDVGIHVDENGSLTGDVCFEEARKIVAAITPVPGGVGTVTTSVLVKHVVEAAKKAVGA